MSTKTCAICARRMTTSEARRNLLTCDTCARSTGRASVTNLNRGGADDPRDWVSTALVTVGAYRADRARQWFEQHPNHTSAARKARTGIQIRCSKYGITLGDWAVMVAEQRSRCAICTKAHSPARLHIDHDHEDGRVRGLLCSACNTALGSLGIDGAGAMDRAQAVVRYIRESNPKNPGVLPQRSMSR